MPGRRAIRRWGGGHALKERRERAGRASSTGCWRSPVHIDPQAGVVWGAALWCMVAASLAIEAARSAFGAFGARRRAGSSLATPWRGQPLVAVSRSSPHRVGGRSGSPDVRARLGRAGAGGAGGRAGRHHPGQGRVLVGCRVLAGAGLLDGPFIQQFTSRQATFSLLIASLGARQSAGSAFGLKALTASALPPALWWQPSLSTRYEGIAREIGGRTPVFGVVMLVLTAAVLAVAIRPLRSRRPAALAATTLLTSGATLATYSDIPVHNIGRHDQNYLLIVLLPAGLLVWLATAAAAVLAAPGGGSAGPALCVARGCRRRIRSALGCPRHRPGGRHPDRARFVAGGGPAGPGVGRRDIGPGGERHPCRRSAHRADAAPPAAGTDGFEGRSVRAGCHSRPGVGAARRRI